MVMDMVKIMVMIMDMINDHGHGLTSDQRMIARDIKWLVKYGKNFLSQKMKSV